MNDAGIASYLSRFANVCHFVEENPSLVYREIITCQTSISEELHVSVHEQDVAAAGRVVEVRHVLTGNRIPHDCNLRLSPAGSGGIVYVRDEKALYTFAQPLQHRYTPNRLIEPPVFIDQSNVARFNSLAQLTGLLLQTLQIALGF